MWIELHDTARGHPKIKKIARDLGVKRVLALGHMASLWSWALQFAADGNLSSFDNEDIADGAQWEGDPDAFIHALVEREALDMVDGELVIHDWEDYAAHLKASERKRKEREKKRRQRSTQSLSRGHSGTSQDSDPLSRGVTQTDQTDQTRQTDQEPDARKPFPLNEPTPRSPEHIAAMRSAVEAYCRTWPKRRALAEHKENREALFARLDEGRTEAELVGAVARNAASQWHRENHVTKPRHIFGTVDDPSPLHQWLDEAPARVEPEPVDQLRVDFDRLCIDHGLGLLYAEGDMVLALCQDLEFMNRCLTDLSADGSQPSVEDLVREINNRKGGE